MEKYDYEINKSCQYLNLWSLYAISNPVYYNILQWTLTIPIYTGDMKLIMQDPTYHHAKITK